MMSRIKEFYDNEALTYDQRRWTGPIGRYVHDVYERLVFEITPLSESTKLLELGCGTGRLTVPLAASVRHVTALDLSKRMLDVTRRRLEVRGIADRVSLIQCGAKKVAFGNGEFDVIVSFNTINHIPGYEEVVYEAARLLRPGGAVVLGYPSLFSLYFPYAMLANFVGKSLRRGVYTKWPRTDRIRNAAEECGLYIDCARGQVHCPPIRNEVGARVIAAGLRIVGSVCESGPLRRLAPTQIIRLRHKP